MEKECIEQSGFEVEGETERKRGYRESTYVALMTSIKVY